MRALAALPLADENRAARVKPVPGEISGQANQQEFTKNPAKIKKSVIGFGDGEDEIGARYGVCSRRFPSCERQNSEAQTLAMIVNFIEAWVTGVAVRLAEDRRGLKAVE